MTKRLALLVVLALAATATAHAREYDPIETRQAGQDLMLGTFSGIRAVVALKGDVKTLDKPAAAMARWITQFPTQFPPGSDKGHNTKALPAIWSDPAGFHEAAENFGAAATKLATLAKTADAEGVAAQVKVVADACDACHKKYRER